MPRYATARSRQPMLTAHKSFLIWIAMILLCTLLYIPIYNRATELMSQDTAIEGWAIDKNRDIKIYVQPNKNTTIHEPKHICPPHTRNKNNNLFLLIIVCSTSTNFDRRSAIRETWGNYKTYLQLSNVYNETREKYKDYNYTYDLDPSVSPVKNYNGEIKKIKRDIRNFMLLLPELAKALQDNLDDNTNEKQTKLHQEKRELSITEFNINKNLGKDDDNVRNVIKIPSKDFEDNVNLYKVLNIIRKYKYLFEEDDIKVNSIVKIDEEPDFKLLFLLGLPNNDDKYENTEIANKIEEEVQTYGDILQEGFIDSYYNLSLKSTMMLKWVTNKCNESVRYILKTDDDFYINVPALVTNLRNRSLTHDLNHPHSKEYLLIGHLHCGMEPNSGKHSKWYCPRYMFSGQKYPRFVMGGAYALSSPTAAALYHAALQQNFFHLEDVFITGICALHASLRPRHDAMFSFFTKPPRSACAAHAHYSVHLLHPSALAHILATLLDPDNVDQCEQERLMQRKEEKMRVQSEHTLYQLYKYIKTLVNSKCE